MGRAPVPDAAWAVSGGSNVRPGKGRSNFSWCPGQKLRAVAWMCRPAAPGTVVSAAGGQPRHPLGINVRRALKERVTMTALPLTTSCWPADTSSPVLETTIGGVLRAAAVRAPGQPALISGHPDPARRREWRYDELLAGAERGAHALIARFRPGDRVAMWAGNCPEWVLLEFAAGLAGMTLVTVNPAYQADELAHVLGHSGARGVVLAADYRGSSLPAILASVRGRLPRLREVIPLAEWDRFCASGGGSLPEVDPADPAQILYTSGTTGRPKAAVLTHRGLTNNARLAGAAIGMRAGESRVNPMPLFHVACGGALTLGVVQGTGTQVLMPHFDPGLALELTETYRGVCFGGAPTTLTALLSHSSLPRRDLSS